MPCRDYGYDDYRNDDYRSTAAEIKRLKERNDVLARISCRVMDMVENDPQFAGLRATILNDPETKEWWDKHSVADRKEREAAARERARLEREAAIKAAAFAKLSDDELAAFNIKRPKPKTEPKAPAVKRAAKTKAAPIELVDTRGIGPSTLDRFF